MDSAKLSDWMQVIGIFALVLSLIFVGLQMRQTQDIAQATLYQMRSDSSRELNIVMIENPHIREVLMQAGAEGLQTLSAGDRNLIAFTIDSVLGHFENSHHLYQLGFLSQEQWDADRRQIQSTIGRFIKSSWPDVRPGYRESFAEEIDALIENSE